MIDMEHGNAGVAGMFISLIWSMDHAPYQSG